MSFLRELLIAFIAVIFEFILNLFTKKRKKDEEKQA